MLKRIITGLALTLVLLPTVIFSHTPLLVAVMLFMALVGEFEMLRCLGLEKNVFVSIPVYLLAAGGAIGARYLETALFFSYAMPAFALFALIIFGVYTFAKGKVTLEQAGGVVGACGYIALAFSAIVLLCGKEPSGRYMLILVFIGAWITDIFAYFTGVFFGKHKLIPDISPKKTIEGSLGGIVFCVLAFAIYGLVLSRSGASRSVNVLLLAVAGFFASIVAQIGDLMMSAIKRARGIKDYGKLFPGHGGVLDRFDSVMAVSVILWVISALANKFI